MTRKALSLAILAALAAPSAFAADAEVKWYGKLHLDFGFVSDDDGTDSASWQQMRSNSSRFGAKGGIAINEDLKAIFKMELGVDADDNAKNNNVTGRSTWIGLKGGWGEVHMGRDDLPYKKATGKYDVMSDTYGDYNDILNKDEDKRQDNSLTYWYKGQQFNFAASYSLDSEAEDNYGKIMAAAVGFKVSNINVDLAAQSTQESADGAEDGVVAVKAGVRGKFGDFGVGLVAESVDPEGDDNNEMNVVLVGTYKVSKQGKIKALYGMKQFEADGVDDATKLALAYEHKYTKNFSLYGVVASGAEGGLDPANKLDGDSSAIAFGGVYKF